MQRVGTWPSSKLIFKERNVLNFKRQAPDFYNYPKLPMEMVGALLFTVYAGSGKSKTAAPPSRDRKYIPQLNLCFRDQTIRWNYTCGNNV